MFIRSKIIRYAEILAWVGLLLIVGGCSKSSSPTSPTVPAAKTLDIIVTASTGTGTGVWGAPVLLLVGTTETLKATARASDGTATPVADGRWSSDNLRVATVEPATGRITIVGAGMVNISVEYLGNTGMIGIRGLPDYRGSWPGNFSFTGCRSSDDYAASDWCSSFSTDKAFPVNLDLTQNLDSVYGRFTSGDYSAEVSGTAGGDLALVGAMAYRTGTVDILLKLSSTTPGKITGTMVWFGRSANMSGISEAYAEIIDMNRMGAAAALGAR